MSDSKKLPNVKMVQRRIAYSSIGPSTLRNQGAAKVAFVAQNFLMGINLGCFAQVRSSEEYLRILDKLTIELSGQFPDKAKNNWGAARKALNVFMEEAIYNKFLNIEYNLDKLTPFLEVPVDSYVVKNLKQESKNRIPAWKGIKHLTLKDNDQWQKIASEVARKRSIYRVYLDIEFWRS